MQNITKQSARDNSLKTQRKSWVASRFILVDDSGTPKRRCRFQNCTKEYSRGTSHMILKRHWSKLHRDVQSETNAIHTSHDQNPSGFISPKTNNRKKLINSSESSYSDISPRSKTSIQNSNANILLGGKNAIGKLQQDVKLVAKRLKEAVSIHLTIEIHAPKKGGKTYGIITAHSLSESFEMRSVLLEYKHLPYPDETQAMFEFIRSCISKFNIREKIVSLASNSSDTIAAAVQEMDKRFRLSKNFNFNSTHIKCFSQFVHLNVLGILRSQESLIETVRKVVTFINNNNFTLRTLPPDGPNNPTRIAVENNPSTNDTGNNDLTNNRPTVLRLPFDNRTSWNTTYTMIETFLEQRGFIEPTLLFFQNPQEIVNIAIDWDQLYTLVQLLKPFHDIINKFAVDNYTPVSLVAVSLPHLMEHLSSSAWAYDELGMAVHSFKNELESYQQFFQSELTVIAGLLDPRVKDTFVTVEGREYAIDILRKRLDTPNQNKSELQAQYSANSIWSRVFRPANFDEVSDYLAQPREHGFSSNITYWRAHKNVYPCLYYLAKALLCVQATSVPSDRIFSAAENSDKERKNQIESTNSKELMKSWAKYLEK